MKKDRIFWLDTAKGILILCVVLGHVADGYINAGMFLNNSSILNFVFKFIYSFHMPVFFFFSGYAFKLAYMEKDSVKKEKVKKQLLNLLYLYVVFSVIQWAFKYVLSDYVNTTFSVKDLLCILIKPMAPYWYLYDLIIYYVIMLMLKGKHEKSVLISCLIIDLFLIAFGFFPNIENKMHYFVFFYSGIYLTEYFKENKFLFVVVLLLSLTINSIYSISGFDNILVKYIISLLFVIVICIGTKIYGNSKNLFSKIGYYCLDIYVFHCYITAGNRVLFSLLNINNFYINFILNSLLGVILPILFSIFLKKIKLYNYIMKPVYVRRDKK